MCDRESFAKLRDQTEQNTQQINALAKRDAEQSVQIASLAKTTEKQGDNMMKLVNRLVMAIIGMLVLMALALIFGALGERGFNAVTKAAPAVMKESVK